MITNDERIEHLLKQLNLVEEENIRKDQDLRANNHILEGRVDELDKDMQVLLNQMKNF